MSTRTRNATKKSTPKQAAAKPAKKVKPIEALSTPDKTQKSVRVHVKLDKLPNGGGGVRFAEVPAKDGSTVLGKVWIDQASFALLDKDETLVIDIRRA